MIPMMSIDNKKWMALWQESGMFKFKPESDKPIFSIDTPPPFTSGYLHIGQAYWVAYIDAIARYMHMKGYNVLYPVGWDMQGFPTEMLVEKKYGKLDRKAFYEKCMEIANENKEVMKKQMLELGATFDEDFEYETASPEYRRKVQLSLLEMYKKGFIYKKKHPVEWCSHCNSSIAREEIEEKEMEGKLYYIKFSVEENGKTFTIATTRPELLHACVAVAFNPNDGRYKELEGKHAIVPLFGNKAKIISDDAIDLEFGTGIEMVCTFGDKNDVIYFYKYGLDYIEAIDTEGRLLNAGKYTGLYAKDAREKIVNDLKEAKLIEKVESIKHTVKVHDKCGTPIELISSEQWFIKTKDYVNEIKQIASEIKWIPEDAIQKLYDWAEYIEWDWSISRNRVFGTPLPFWQCNDCNEIIPADEKELPVNPAFDKPPRCPKCGSTNVEGVKETCDVWVDSSITPLVIAGWPDNKELLKKAYPASMRIQGNDITRTWAFYTIVRNFAITGTKPFEKILVTGMILGSDGREMHKSYGNGVLPSDVLKKYDVDALRLWAALSGSIGKSKIFSYNDLDYAEAFITKLYNSAMFVKKAEAEVGDREHEKMLNLFDAWIIERFNAVAKEANDAYMNFDLNAAMNKLVSFYWHEFCDYYIEDVKHRVYKKDASGKTAVHVLKHVLNGTLKLMAPVIPFVAEEVNSLFDSRSIFTQEIEEPKNESEGPDYIINGVVFSSIVPQLPYSDIGTVLNDIIGRVRKEKSTRKMPLNKEITAINIYLPEKYYKAVELAKKDIEAICKAHEVKINKSENFSVSIEV